MDNIQQFVEAVAIFLEDHGFEPIVDTHRVFAAPGFAMLRVWAPDPGVQCGYLCFKESAVSLHIKKNFDGLGKPFSGRRFGWDGKDDVVYDMEYNDPRLFDLISAGFRIASTHYFASA